MGQGIIRTLNIYGLIIGISACFVIVTTMASTWNNPPIIMGEYLFGPEKWIEMPILITGVLAMIGCLVQQLED